MTEPNTDSGTSVTNACEDIVTDIFQGGLVGMDHENVIWVEHYREKSFFETYDRVTFLYDNRSMEFKNPSWEHLGKTLTDENKMELLKKLEV